MLWSLLWQDQAVLREISRPHGARLLTSFESRQYSTSQKISSTRTFKNNIQWWEILPYSDKELRLKRSLSWGYNLRKRIVLVLLTAVDLRRSIMCCVTRQYLFRIHFFASQRLSGGPAYLYNYIYLLLSSFFFFFFYKCKFFKDICHSRSRLFTTMYYVTKRKSLQCFDQRISRAFPGNLHIF